MVINEDIFKAKQAFEAKTRQGIDRPGPKILDHGFQDPFLSKRREQQKTNDRKAEKARKASRKEISSQSQRTDPNENLNFPSSSSSCFSETCEKLKKISKKRN